MAVAVNEDRLTLEAARGEVRSLGRKPVGQQPHGFAQLLGARVVGEELGELVAEDAGATWLEENEGQAGIDLRSHAVEDVGEIGAGGIEKTEVVEWATAADVTFGDMDAEAGLGEEGFGCAERLRMVVVVPGIGPENDL